MHTKSFWSWTAALVLLAALTVGGCAKKQIRTEGETVPATQVTEVAPSPPPVRTPQPQEREVRTRPVEPPPPDTAATVPAPEAPVTGAGLSQETTMGLERIHFDFDKSVIKPEYRDVMADNAEYLQENPGVRIRIEGHCDERGTTEYNLALGERRAQSAFQYLMDLGIDPNRMTTVSYGEEVPLDPRHNPEAWAKNRRAEFVEIQR